MSERQDRQRDFSVTFDTGYHFWSIGCLQCGAEVTHCSFARAFAFTAKHRKCDIEVSNA